MPLYDYDCSACGRRFEVVHGVHAEGPTLCPICGHGPVRKAITAAAVHYKGTGWAKKERRATATPGVSKPAGEDAATPEPGGKGGDDAGSAAGAAAATVAKPADTTASSKAD